MSEDRAEYGSKSIRNEKTGKYDKPFNSIILTRVPDKFYEGSCEPMPQSEVQIGNIVDEVNGDIPDLSKANALIKDCLNGLNRFQNEELSPNEEWETIYDLRVRLEEYLKSLEGD